MSVGRYALGVVALVCIVGSLGLGAAAARAVLVPAWRGASARLADIVLALALLILICQLLGAVTLFKLVPITAASVAVGLALRLWLGPVGPEQSRRSEPDGNRLLTGLILLVALLAAGVVLAEWAGPTLQSYGRGITGADSVSYHMPWAASFAQTGQVTSIRYTDIQYLTGFYPATSEMLHGLGIVLFANDVLSPGLNFLWLALVLLAAYCIGQPRGVGAATLLAGAIVMGAPMMFFSTAGSADNDAVAVFFMVAAVAFWLNTGTAGAERAGAEVGLGGVLLTAIAAGLAISVKLNLLLPVAVLTVTMIWWAPRGRRSAVTGVWAAGVFVAGGFWYLRNLIAAGNPLPYFSFGFLPTPQPAPLQQHTNYSIYSYAGYPRILKDVFAHALANGLGPWWVVILVLAVLGALPCVAFGPDRLVRIVALFALLSLAAYLVTPGSASGPWGNPKGFFFNLRYGAPALTVALAMGPLAAPFARRAMRWLPIVGLGAIFLAGILQKRLWSPGYAIRSDVAAAAGALVVGALVLLIPYSRARAAPFLARVGVATATGMLLLAGAAAGYGGQRHYLRVRYTNEQGLTSVTLLWRWARSVKDQPIAFAGTFGWYFGYPIYGSNDSNKIAYIGRHGSHGSFTLIQSCRAWDQAVNAGHYRYIVTSSSRTMWTGQVTPLPEGAWTIGDPAVKLQPGASSSWIQVFSVSGQLNPARCAAR